MKLYHQLIYLVYLPWVCLSIILSPIGFLAMLPVALIMIVLAFLFPALEKYRDAMCKNWFRYNFVFWLFKPAWTIVRESRLKILEPRAYVTKSQVLSYDPTLFAEESLRILENAMIER